MGSSKAPPPPPPPPPPVSATGADQAQAAIDAKKKEKGRYDFSKTLLAPGGLAAMPPGTKNTLG